MKEISHAKPCIGICLTMLFAISFPCASIASFERSGVGLMPRGFELRPIASATEAADHVTKYILERGLKGLHVSEVLEFGGFWFVCVDEDDSQMGAFCLNVATDGKIESKKFPAMDPEMMWNQKYGHDARPDESSIHLKIDASEARRLAEKEISKNLKMGKAKSYYGYHLFRLYKDDVYVGEAVVNAVNGKVLWGKFAKTPLVKRFEPLEVKEEE